MSHLPQQVQGDGSAGMRYERLFELGSGGMASVELALAVGPSGFNRLVVLKSMRKELAASEDAYSMFLAEARLSARLAHPNVVHISEVLDTPEGAVLVMEYLDGLSLVGAYRAANAALTLPMRLRVICDVLTGLEYAHELTDFLGRPLGIVHRDVSPQNVFLTYDGRVKLLDFGIAKAASTEQTRAGMVKGRIAYMPVEQLTAEAVDRRTDVYSVGCLLWEGIAGSRIWQDRSERDIARSVVSGEIPRLGSRVRVDPELERIVTKATAFAPDERYATAEAMRVELERYLTSLGVTVTAREIGEMLSNVSGPAREKRQRAIAEAIAALGLDDRDGTSSRPRRTISAVRRIELRNAAASAEADAAQRYEEGGPASGATPPPESVEDARSTTSTKISSRRPQRSRLPLFVALIGVLGVGAFFGYVRFTTQRDMQAAETARAALDRQAPPPAATARALTITARPNDARVFVDGSEISGNPAVVDVPVGSEHSVRVEREGYETNERVVAVREDMTLSIELSAKPAAGDGASSASEKPRSTARPVPPARPVRAPVAPAPPATTDSKNCEPPFYFVNGNKTYKPECI
jgi:eukaryotic-like serine/threonine-protein kinase